LSAFDGTVDPVLMAIVAHGLLGDAAVVGSAAQTLSEHWDRLDPGVRSQLLRMIVDHAHHVSEVLDGLARGLPLQARLAVGDPGPPGLA
jgi:hypothetical protein